MSISHLTKSPDAINAMREMGKVAASTLDMIAPHVKKGVTTDELNTLCHEYMVNTHGVKPAPLGYRGFPKSICTSVNHVICHGIPNDRPLKEGDILNIDVSMSKDGYFSDTCKMFFVGKPSIMAQRIVRCAQEAMYLAIAKVKPGVGLHTIGKTIQDHAEKKYGYSVVREFCGHGIGEQLHEEGFQVLHYLDPNSPNHKLEVGHTFTIEPMINVGKRHMKVLNDGWTAVTKDRSLSAQFEHTILVTENGFEILSLREEEKDLDLNKLAAEIG